MGFPPSRCPHAIPTCCDVTDRLKLVLLQGRWQRREEQLWVRSDLDRQRRRHARRRFKVLTAYRAAKSVNGNFGLDNTVAPSSGSLIELGAGSLKKTSVLLRAIYGHLQTAQQDSTGVKDVTYYALDLEHAQLVKTLEQLETTESDAVTSETTRDERGDNRITIKGICAAYEEAFPVLKDGKYDSESSSASSDDEQRTSILFLGSSIGNYARDEAVAFLKQLADEAMKPGDTLLIGLDSCDDKATIERAYNDSQKLTEQFILNGVDHVDRILGGVGLKQTDFRYTNTYNKEKGRHEVSGI